MLILITFVLLNVGNHFISQLEGQELVQIISRNFLFLFAFFLRSTQKVKDLIIINKIIIDVSMD